MDATPGAVAAVAALAALEAVETVQAAEVVAAVAAVVVKTGSLSIRTAVVAVVVAAVAAVVETVQAAVVVNLGSSSEAAGKELEAPGASAGFPIPPITARPIAGFATNSSVTAVVSTETAAT